MRIARKLSFIKNLSVIVLFLLFSISLLSAFLGF